jgi:hypothetical protein
MADCLCGIIFYWCIVDFKEQNLYEAIISYQKRTFGKTSEQIK